MDKNKLHDLTLTVLKKYNFDNVDDLSQLTDDIATSYKKVNQQLKNKFKDEGNDDITMSTISLD